MEFASLQPVQLWIDEISIQVNPDFKSDSGPRRAPNVTLETRIEELLDEDGNIVLYRPAIRVEASPIDGEQILPYEVAVAVSGLFAFPIGANLAQSEMRRTVAFNGLAILYGFARDVVLHDTAMGQHGAMILPAVNLVSIAEGYLTDGEYP